MQNGLNATAEWVNTEGGGLYLDYLAIFVISYFKYFCLNVNIPYLDCTVTAISDAGNQNMQKHIQQMADYMMIKSGTLAI